jgi:hypothetical protein
MSNPEAITLHKVKLDHICDLMRNLKWRTGKTGKELAKKWDMSESRMKHLAAQASSIVRAEVTNPDRVTRSVGAALEDAIYSAHAAGDFKAVIMAAKTWAEVMGTAAPRQVGIQVSEADLTTEELEARLAALASQAKQETSQNDTDREIPEE